MNKLFHLLFFIVYLNLSFGQNISDKYHKLIKKAESFYQAQDYKNSAYAYSEAFRENGWKATPNDRYNAACSWAMANNPDSAFFNLMCIVSFQEVTNYGRVTTDSDLSSLHEDKRWKIFIELVKQKRDAGERQLNKPLTEQLDTIFEKDQKYRLQMDEVGKKYGWQSKEMTALWKIANTKDSLNLIKVKAILDAYGWLGPEVVGQQGNTTLFLVIQHSDQQTQEKYLPMMREAVKNKKASSASLALLEDRVALGQGKKQIYGSQIGRDANSKEYVLPLEDPDNVDKRRAEVGLGPLQDYVNHWGIKWDAEEYKKSEALKTNNDLPKISSVKLDDSQILSWTLQNGNSKENALIEQFRWNKWIRIGAIETVSGISQYSFEVALHHGENKFKISMGNRAREIFTYTSAFPAISYKISNSSGEIQFSAKTLFEIIDLSGKIIKKGFADKITITEIPKGKYTLNYDNSSTLFVK